MKSRSVAENLEKKNNGNLTKKAVFDTDLLGTGNTGSGYVNAIETGADLEEDEEDMDSSNMPKLGVKQVNWPFL